MDRHSGTQTDQEVAAQAIVNSDIKSRFAPRPGDFRILDDTSLWGLGRGVDRLGTPAGTDGRDLRGADGAARPEYAAKALQADSTFLEGGVIRCDHS